MDLIEKEGKFLDQLKNMRRRYLPSKSGYPSIKLYCVIYRETTTRICSVVITPNTLQDLTIFSHTGYTTCGETARLGVRFAVVTRP